MTIQIQIRREFRCTDVFRGWGSVEVSHLPAGKEEDGLEEAHCGQASLHCSCQLLLVRQTVQELWQSSTSQHKVWRWLSVTSSSWLSIITVNIDTRNHKMQSFGVPAHLIITHTTKDANEREQKYLGNSQDAIACVIPWEILISKGQDTKYVYKIGPRFTFAVIQIMFVYFGAYPTQGKYVDDKDHCGE